MTKERMTVRHLPSWSRIEIRPFILTGHYRLSRHVGLRTVINVAADKGWKVTEGIGHVGLK
jgi:hypothetical protein